MKRKNDKLLNKSVNLAGLCSLGTIGLMIALLCLSPNLGGKAKAEALDTAAFSASLATKTTAKLYSMISVSLSESIDIDIVPKSTGALGVGTAKLNIATNNTTGYAIYLSTIDGTNSLNPINPAQQYQGNQENYAIKALAGSTTASDYLKDKANLNTWGYALTTAASSDAPTYKGLTNTSGDNIYSSKGTTASDSYDLSIAVAVDASLPAGGYRNGIVVSAVANPIAVSGFQKIYYMQEMTASICEGAEIHEMGQLVDKRDNNIYWVAKLKDGNCWMVQNLDLDLASDVALTPEDSDVEKDWLPEKSTNSIPLASTVLNDDNYNDSWDFGKAVTVAPMQETLIHEDVTNGWMPTYTAAAGEYNGQAYEYLTVDQSNKTYDAHYLTGNLYQYNAATAGTGATLTAMNERATSSICPKGWQLPTNGFDADKLLPLDLDGGFYHLLMNYGLTKNVAVYNFVGEGMKLQQELVQAPLYLARTGTIYYDRTQSQFLMNNEAVSYLSDTAHTASSFLTTFINTTTLEVANGTPRVGGATIRCVAKK